MEKAMTRRPGESFDDIPFHPAHILPDPIKRPLRLYVSGPMTGYEDFNFPAFDEAAETLRALSFEVRTPAENLNGQPKVEGWNWSTFIRKDIANLLWVDAVVVLPGWEYSKGACMEIRIALAIDIPILSSATLLPVEDEQAYIDFLRPEAIMRRL